MKTIDKALEYFDSGFNCAQSVLLSYCDALKIDKNNAMNISLAFGGGFGRLSKTCGAVTGALMVIGLKYSDKIMDKKEYVYRLTREFYTRFEKALGTCECELLTGCKLNTPEGQDKFNNEHVAEKCREYIRTSISILESLDKS